MTFPPPSSLPTPASSVGQRLRGKRVLITGTGGGQGRAAQELFAVHGAHVVGCDVLPGAAAASAAELRAEGLAADGFDVNLSDPDAAAAWVGAAATSLGGIDVLYNNASKPAIAPFEELTLEQWRFNMTNELELLFTVTQAAWPHFIAAGGSSVINTASNLATLGLEFFGFASHAAAKGGVLGLTRQLAAEGAKHRIRVNAISPGFVDTPAVRGMPKEAYDHIVNKIQVIRAPLEALDIAYLALFLASDESRFVTGAEYPVDGGASGVRPA